MTPQQFIAKWKPSCLSERAACQEHFIDLCNLLGQPTPAAVDPDGTWFTFERHVQCVDGGKGFADVWKKGHFGWEYKGKHKDLAAAYQQLLRYREDLENPPLLVVCDIDRFEIHTNFTNTAKRKHEFDLDALSKPANLNVLRHLFTQPDALRPGQSPETVTQQVAEQFGQLADGMRSRGVDPQRAAHFLMKLMFCMFAEDIELLPEKIFHRIVQANTYDPSRLTALLGGLFKAMSDGSDFGAERILRFNGGLFADADVVPLRADDIGALVHVSRFDWGSVEPSIFGTLFERTLDPAKRSRSAPTTPAATTSWCSWSRWSWRLCATSGVKPRPPATATGRSCKAQRGALARKTRSRAATTTSACATSSSGWPTSRFSTRP
ncbi:MAG TPA: type IIL restriction-modification enzyme MmeI, partial [Pirellulales bacterium]|nr:type IIL restriction-modification enzyme MmeI [Pirellulales bacterium]